jgi:hypothetical protein
MNMAVFWNTPHVVWYKFTDVSEVLCSSSGSDVFPSRLSRIKHREADLEDGGKIKCA